LQIAVSSGTAANVCYTTVFCVTAFLVVDHQAAAPIGPWGSRHRPDLYRQLWQSGEAENEAQLTAQGS
jgi:hypothetical protein